MTILFIILMYFLIKREWNRKNRFWTDERIKRESIKQERRNEENYQKLVKGTRMGSDEALALRLKHCDRANGERHNKFYDFFRKEVNEDE